MLKLKNSIATLPAVLIALLPQLFCPACWPAYTSILSSLGIGFVNYSPLLLPLTGLFLLMAIGGIVYKAETRQGYYPFFLAILASALIILAKFVVGMSMVLYVGILLLLIASVWNAWPKKVAVCASD